MGRVKSEHLSDAQIRRRAWKVLLRELGLGGFARFLRQFDWGFGDYTQQRHEYLRALSFEELTARLLNGPPASRAKERAARRR